ncbi:RDD family protein [Streptomyces sclerotialus]|uniref:RDD family protein n=1 Tax=Streptomyces sclerotialus TaxID=1957 RepID=UPI0004CBB5BB
MSTDQPRPGSGEPPEDDPFLKKPQRPREPGGDPYGGAPQGPYGGGPYGGGPPPGGGPYGGPPGGGPYGGPPGGGPYGGGDPYGAPDPLAGMPPLAGRGRRLVARIIDGILIGVPVGLIMWFIVGGVDYTAANESGKQSVVSGVTMLAYLIYEGVMLTSRGQTVGKMAMKIRVAMLENGSIPTAQAGWVRAAVYTLPEVIPCCGTIFWLLNVLWCTWDKPYQQCLHDKAARTVVVSTA